MSVVKFNDVEEFCAEIENDAPEIDRGIVRSTDMSRMSSVTPNIRHIFAMASYSVNGQIVILECYCGDVWGVKQDEDNKVYEKSEKIRQIVTKTCETLGLHKRAGILEERTQEA